MSFTPQARNEKWAELGQDPTGGLEGIPSTPHASMHALTLVTGVPCQPHVESWGLFCCSMHVASVGDVHAPDPVAAKVQHTLLAPQPGAEGYHADRQAPNR